MTDQTAASSPPVELQPRDKTFLAALYEFEGVLPERLVRQHFYPGISDKTFNARLRKLRDSHYVKYPSRRQKQEHPVPEKVYWLGARGIAELAAERGIDAGLPKKLTNNAQEEYKRRLKKAGLHWVREPHWRLLKHHIAVCDLRFVAQQATDQCGLTWDRWISEREFRSDPSLQTVTYSQMENRSGGERVRVEKMARVYPDGFFTVTRPLASRPGKVEEFAFLVEVDRGTEQGPRVVEEKILPGEVYLKSQGYQRRTGVEYGRWLFITTGPVRADNLKQAAERVSRKPSFYFSHFDDLTPETFFTKPVWHLLGKTAPLPLLPPAR